MGRLRQSTEAIQRILDESDGLREFTERELNTLKGEGEGSIKQALNEVLGGASEAYDTLKEIEEYIERDEAGAVALAQSIARLETEKVSTEDIDSSLSTESENPVQNKVVTEELNKKAAIEALTILGESVANSITSLEEKKANKTDIAQSDWNASKQEKGHILNRTHYVDLTYFEHLTINKNDFDLSFDGSYWIAEYKTLLNEEQLFVYCSADGKEFYSPIGDSEIKLPNSIYVKRIEVFSDYGDFVGIKLVVRNGGIDEEFRGESFYFADIWSYPHIKELPSIYIPDTIAREESVEELRDETTALWENLDHGVFPNLVAGDLAGRGESVPASFGFRASGGKSIKDGRAYIKRIKGNSVVWNQKVKRLNNVSNGVSSNFEGNVITLNGVCTTTWAAVTQEINVIQGHKYLIVGHVLTNPNGLSFKISLFNNVIGRPKFDANTNFSWSIGVCSGSRVSGFGVDGFPSGTDLTGIQFRTIVIDLTQLFQAGNEPTTFEEFYARVATLGIDLNAYNEGQVIHCNTESIKSVGDNAWDEQWGIGRLNTDTGQPNYGNNGIFSKNYIRVLPNETYYCGYNAAPIFAMFYDAEYNLILQVSGSNHFINIRNRQFTTPANAVYMRFYVTEVTTYNNDILISLYHSGWKAQKDDQYQPYWQDTLPLPIIRKYFPDGMKSAGSAHDEIRFNKASGKWEYSKGKIKSVDMGSLSYHRFNVTTKGVEWYFFVSNDLKGIAQLPQYTTVGNALSPMYNLLSAIALDSREMSDKSMMLYSQDSQLYFRNDAYTDEATFKAAMQGVMLYYESTDWEWVELDAEDQNFRDYYQVADFGTEQSQSAVPSAPFSADIIYQFNAVDMIREHELEITELQSIIATMQAQLTSLTNGVA